MALMCMVGLAIMTTACQEDNPNEDLEENGGENTGENSGGNSGNGQQDELTDYVAICLDIFNNIKPGIYTCMDGSTTGVVAKGTDGSGFLISDINDYTTYYPTIRITSNALPNGFSAFDGDRTAYTFVYSQPLLHEGSTATWQGLIWNEEMIYKLVDVYPNRNAMFNATGTMLSIAIMSSTLTKIDDAGNFQETYMKLADRYQKFSHKIGPDKMMPQMTVWNPKQWRSDLYPDEMNQKKHVIPYTGGGSFEWMTVNRWMPTGPSLPLLNYPCYVDYVEYIEACYFNVSEADARAYVKKVKEEAPVKNIRHDDDTTGPDENGNTIIMFHFQSDGSPETGDLGYTYCFPGYEVIYFNEAGQSSLTIKFTTNYLTIV